MTAQDLYSHRELLELAALDAFGQLDEFEADLFNRSFHHAPVPLQEQIKRLQAEITSDDQLLPDEEPNRALRQRVLAAVASAIEADEERFQPIARIGRAQIAIRDLRRRRLGGSGQFWRAATFVLAGVTVAMAYFLSDTLNKSHDIVKAAILNDALRVQAILGPTTTDFVLGESKKIELRPTDTSLDYLAAVYVNSRSGEAIILTDKLPRTEGDGYVLRVVFDNGTKQLTQFPSTGSLTSVKLAGITTQILASAMFWEITDLAGNVIMTSA